MLVWLAFLVCTAIVLYPGLFYSQIPAFRDSFHFYYPQAIWLDKCFQSGDWFPTWNPSEGLGSSVSGQPSSAIYYPLRALLHLPWFNLEQRFSIFIAAHFLLAAAGMRLATLQLGFTPWARWLTSIAFAFSCPVVFQHSNLIYLCSAAWVGFCVAIYHRTQTTVGVSQKIAWGILGLLCCLMFLAGDPHTSANIFVALGGITVFHKLREAFHAARRPKERHLRRTPPRFLNTCVGLTIAFSVFLASSSVQWIPTLRWSSQSNRVNRSLEYEVDQQLASIVNSPAGSVDSTYNFSLSPWHAFTAYFPTLGGSFLPKNSRVFEAIPAEGRMWLPSLYFGILPALLVATALLNWRRNRILSTAVIICFLFSIGNYSITWFLTELLAGTNASDLFPESQWGSFYGLLTWLPGYSLFRYPAKWTVLFVAATTLLAGAKYSENELQLRTIRDFVSTYKIALLIIFYSSTAGLLTTLFFQFLYINGVVPGLVSGVEQYLSNSCYDRWLGSPQALDIVGTLVIAFLTPITVLLLLRCISLLYPKMPLPAVIVILTLVELTFISSHWIIFTSPPDPPLVSSENAIATRSSLKLWSDTSEADIRVDCPEIEAEPGKVFTRRQTNYQSTFALGKLGSLHGAGSLNATQSLTPAATSKLCAWLQKEDSLRPEQPQLDRILASLGVTHRLVRIRTDGVSDFRWQQINAPATLCHIKPASRGTELSEAESLEKNDPKISWEWHGSDKLSLEVSANISCKVRVLQLNDGGWRLTQYAKSEDIQLESKTLFVEFHLEAGQHTLQLSRRAFW